MHNEHKLEINQRKAQGATCFKQQLAIHMVKELGNTPQQRTDMLTIVQCPHCAKPICLKQPLMHMTLAAPYTKELHC